MKLLLVIMCVLMSTSAFSNYVGRKATKAESKEFCQAIDKALAAEQADMALDMKGCLKTSTSTDEVIIRGNVPFRSPTRSSFKMHCEGALSSLGNGHSILCR